MWTKLGIFSILYGQARVGEFGSIYNVERVPRHVRNRLRKVGFPTKQDRWQTTQIRAGRCGLAESTEYVKGFGHLGREIRENR